MGAHGSGGIPWRRPTVDGDSRQESGSCQRFLAMSAMGQAENTGRAGAFPPNARRDRLTAWRGPTGRWRLSFRPAAYLRGRSSRDVKVGILLDVHRSSQTILHRPWHRVWRSAISNASAVAWPTARLDVRIEKVRKIGTGTEFRNLFHELTQSVPLQEIIGGPR